METNEKKRLPIASIITIAIVIVVLIIGAVKTNADTVQGTFWSVIPPVIAIVLALVTKEVYSSLFIGIVSGGLLFADFNLEATVSHIFNEGLIASLCDPYNMGILIFLVILGMMVALMNKSGGSAAFGEWASRRIKTRKGAQLSTIALGILIFIDDYFNCLTVGSVMRPVTDKHKVSRAKLAYLIDATAAPICIIAPISSWAAAVSGLVKNYNGFTIFLQSIPYNYYALLTIGFMIALVVMNVDFGPMATHERNAIHGDLFTAGDRPYVEAQDETVKTKGTVADMLFPIICLIICCIIGMIYTGGFFSGESIVSAFAGSDASVGLAYGSFFAVLLTFCFYMIRRVISFKDFMDCFPEGFRAMVPAILILTFAWTLKAMTGSLGSEAFVKGIVNSATGAWLNFIPVIVFLIGAVLAFATGTSWGTFGILIPIVTGALSNGDYTLMIISISACMAGAVCGDHCSPISDTTIMASAGAQSNHVNHVSTQLPYALMVAAVSAVTYLVAGFVRNPIVSLVIGIVLTVLLLFFLKKIHPEDDMSKA